MKDIMCQYCPLHEDLIIEILLRMPVKALLRFKSVCQHWRTIILSQGFIRNHFLQEGNSSALLVYWETFVSIPEKYKYELVYSISSFHGKNGEIHDKDHRELKLLGPILGMQGPCNGLFCVLLGDDKLALWNPATRKLRLVPPSPVQGLSTRYLGFARDPLTDDLKIVLIDGLCIQPHFAVYNLSNDSWRSFEEEALVDFGACVEVGYRLLSPSFSNGFHYWVKRKSLASNHFVILSFNLRNESFQEIEMPTIIHESSLERQIRVTNQYFIDLFEKHGIFSSGLVPELHLYDGSLALLTPLRLDEGCFDTWLMKEQGYWTKIPFQQCQTIGVWKRNQIFARTNDWKRMLYDINPNNKKYLDYQRIKYIPPLQKVTLPIPYDQSLVSP